MQGALYSVAGWTTYLPEVAVSLLLIMVIAWLNTKDTELSEQFQFFAVVFCDSGGGNYLRICPVGLRGNSLHLLACG